MTEKGYHYSYQIDFKPSYSIVNIYLEDGQDIKAESGTMIYQSPNISIETTKAAKGFWASLKRTLAGESFWINTFLSENGPGMIGLAPPYPGDIMHIPLESGTQWMVYSGGFIACSPNVDMGTKFSGFKKGMFGGERMFFLLVSAEENSDLFVSALGGFYVKDLQPGESLVVDNSHLVAMETSTSWEIRKVGGLKSTLFSGEGLVIQVEGPGKVIFQTRSPAEVISWIWRLLPKSSG